MTADRQIRQPDQGEYEGAGDDPVTARFHGREIDQQRKQDGGQGLGIRAANPKAHQEIRIGAVQQGSHPGPRRFQPDGSAESHRKSRPTIASAQKMGAAQ